MSPPTSDLGTTAPRRNRPGCRLGSNLVFALVLAFSPLAARAASLVQHPGPVRTHQRSATSCVGLAPAHRLGLYGLTRNGGALANRTQVAGSSPMPRQQAALSLPRIRSRRFLQGDYQNDCSLAGNDLIPLSRRRVTVAPSEAVPPVSFLSVERTRGPPRAEVHSPRLSDGAQDRPAPQFCASPPPWEFHLYHSYHYATHRVRPLACCCRAAPAPGLLRPASQSDTTRLFAPRRPEHEQPTFRSPKYSPSRC